MSNMSYCRFQNTLQDLKDCNEHLCDRNLSDAEKKARKRLVEICEEIVGGYCESFDEDDDDEEEDE